MSEREARIEDWVGRREREQDIATGAPVQALAATLNRDEPPPQPGDPIPLGWHWLYFLPKARHSEIGPDGHRKRGGFLPPVALPRRMFAGGRMTFHRPLLVGERLEREAEIVSISEKEGRSGRLVFVTVRYRVSGERGPAVEEEQHLVYREEASAAKTTTGVPAEVDTADWHRTIEPDPVLLFRFSALTFNGHRIHYDYPYVTGVEGYPGLVVHGTLIAILLLELCRDFAPDHHPSGFWFQARRPLFADAPFTLSGRLDPDAAGCGLQAIDPEGLVAMSGGATFAA